MLNCVYYSTKYDLEQGFDPKNVKLFWKILLEKTDKTGWVDKMRKQI
ncbi:MAG: hypothetical protein K6C40_10000 [Thermoguttaceae bacterium]|nr:hypothetical protein [Thermoguttaceae bacterium]